MPKTAPETYTSHQDLLQEVKAMNTFRDYRQGGSGTFAQMQKNPTHKFHPKKTYQATTNSNDSVVLEKKGKQFWMMSIDKTPR